MKPWVYGGAHSRGLRKGGAVLERFPFEQKFRDFRSEIEWNVKIPGKVFENLGIRFECTLFDGISGIIENFVLHSQEMSGLVSLPSVSSRGHLKKQ